MKQEISTDTDKSPAILQEIGRAFGRIPNLFQAYARYPLLLEANWNKVKLVLLNGKLSRRTKEIIALLVSRDNGCTYCVAAHSAALKSLGTGANQLARLINGNLSEHLDGKDIELVKFILKANQPTHDIGECDFNSLVSMGHSEAEIIEALGVMELFAGFNRFAKAMKIESDF